MNHLIAKRNYFYSILCLLIFLLVSLPFILFGNENSKSSDDYKLDSKTSKAIPGFIGEVLFLKGRVVKITSNQGKEEENLIMVGQKLGVGDTIKTGKKSFFKCRMVDDTFIALGENSSTNFLKFDFKSKTNRNAIYQIVKGQVRAIFKEKSEDGNSIQVQAGAVSFGIRGTEIAVNMFDNKAGEQVRELGVISGSVQVKNGLSNKESEIKAKEHYISVNSDKESKELSQTLSEGQLKSLTETPLDQKASENEEANFLEFYNNKDGILVSSSRSPSSLGVEKSNFSEVNEGNEGNREEDQSKKWKKSLKKLNKIYKENESTNSSF